MAMAVDLDAMYKSYGILEEAKDRSKHEKEYMVFLHGVKSDEKTKQLAADFLQRYFDGFPAHQEHALDALMDLCEEPSMQIRSKAITSLFKIAKDNTNQIIRIADIITQFLQSEDESERKNVEDYLLKLLNVDAKSCIRGMFNHVGLNEEGVPPILQRRILQFLKNKSTDLPVSMSQDEVAQYILQKTASVISDGSKEDSTLALEFLHSLRYFNTVAGTQQILDVLERVAELDKPFTFEDIVRVEKLIRATEMSLTMFSRTTPSNKFVLYYTRNVVPLIDPNSENPKYLELLRLFAQTTTTVGDLLDYEEAMMIVLDKTLDILPLADDAALNKTVAGLVPVVTSSENKNSTTAAGGVQPKLYLGYVECLLYSLHQLGKRHEQFLKDAGNVALAATTAAPDVKTQKIRRFKKQLQYYSQLKAAYERKFESTRKKKMLQPSALSADTKRQFEIVSRMINNVTLLIRDLFHSPPTYTSQIKLSWKTHPPAMGSESRKRITYDNSAGGQDSTAITGSKNGTGGPINNSKRMRGGQQNGSSFAKNVSGASSGSKQPVSAAIQAKRAALWRK